VIEYIGNGCLCEGGMVMGEVLIRNLEETRERLVSEIQLLPYAKLNQKPGADGWSIAQVCHHLFLTERTFTQAIEYGLKKDSTRTRKTDPVPLVELLTDRTRKRQAPEKVVPVDTPLELPQLFGLLKESRRLFLDMYNQLDDKTVLAEKSVKHPLFGYIPLYQWAELIYLHEARHIEQIKEIKSLINE